MTAPGQDGAGRDGRVSGLAVLGAATTLARRQLGDAPLAGLLFAGWLCSAAVVVLMVARVAPMGASAGLLGVFTVGMWARTAGVLVWAARLLQAAVVVVWALSGVLAHLDGPGWLSYVAAVGGLAATTLLAVAGVEARRWGSAGQWLYRLYDGAGRLLYVGITNSPRHRFGQHAATKVWWGQVAVRELAYYPNRAAVEEAERYAIRRERPLHNVVHNGRRVA